MIDVVALGELLIDFAPVSANAAGYPTVAAQPGGAPGNFLAALQTYGCTAALIGKVGADRFGDLLRATLAGKGIDTRGIVSDPAVFTTLAFVTLDATGNREFSFARKPGAATQKAVAYAKEKGRLISFDPNLRKPLWPSETAAKEQIEWGLHQADIVKISDEEIAFLWGLSPEEGAQKLLKEYGVQLVYATLGPRGCRFANRQGSGEVASPAGIHVVDTTGAGDIFGGSAMSQFLKTGKAPADLTVEEMRAITRFACCAASLSTQTHGGIDSVPEERLVHDMLRIRSHFALM